MTHFTPTFHCISSTDARAVSVLCVITVLCIEVLHESHSAVHCCCLSHITTTRGLSRPIWLHCRPRARLSWPAGVVTSASQTNGVFQRRPGGRHSGKMEGGRGLSGLRPNIVWLCCASSKGRGSTPGHQAQHAGNEHSALISRAGTGIYKVAPLFSPQNVILLTNQSCLTV